MATTNRQMLATVEQVSVEPIKVEPAVGVKKSVFADHILCLDCGQGFKMLKRHVSTDSGLGRKARRLPLTRIQFAVGGRVREL
jgi:predicted transcriptional regulator